MQTVSIEALSKRYRITRSSPLGAMAPMWLRRALGRGRPTYGEIWALRGVTLDADDGTVLGIIGPNGAGKSTLLKVLARISPPTSGRVRVRGRVVPLLDVGAAMQPEATGRENVFLNAAFYGIPRIVAQRRMAEIMEFAGLSEFADTEVRRYSSGMYVRLAFSVAVNMEPDVLLADEVLAVGDLEFQERCLRRVEEAGASGLTVLFVSHDMAAIRRLCNRVIWLNSGRIMADGEPDEVVKAYERFTWDRLEHDGQSGAHANRYGEILHAQLLDDEGNDVHSVRVADSLRVAITFRTNQPKLGCRCVCLFSANGVDAFRSAQPEPIDVGEPGVYVAELRIPPNLLADTFYAVKASVWFRVDDTEDRNNAIVLRDALTFRVWDTDEGSSARGSYTESLWGVVRPKLEWSIHPRAAAESGARPSLRA